MAFWGWRWCIDGWVLSVAGSLMIILMLQKLNFLGALIGACPCHVKCGFSGQNFPFLDLAVLIVIVGVRGIALSFDFSNF